MSRSSDFIQLVEKTASDTKVTLPTDFSYRYAPYECWKCGKQIVIYKWCDNSLMEGEIEKPPEPIPHTIQERSTSMGGETYWANTCPHCKSVQGDFYISNEPDSPFFGLESEFAKNKESFDADMEQIAEYYYDYVVPSSR